MVRSIFLVVSVDEPITRPEKSYRLCCVVVCDLETSRMRRPWPTLGRNATRGKKRNILYNMTVLIHFVRISPSIHLREMKLSCSNP